MVRRVALVLVFPLLVVAARSVFANSDPAMGGMGQPFKFTHEAFVGYYDGHKDIYFSTDASRKSEAQMMGVNYSPALNIPAALTPLKGAPIMYLVRGRSAAGQIAVFGSEPGDPNYTPLWRETIVRWRAGVKPVLLVRDDQITALAKKGRLSLDVTGVVLNCPIVKIGQ
jgi:hypothetical protein